MGHERAPARQRCISIVTYNLVVAFAFFLQNFGRMMGTNERYVVNLSVQLSAIIGGENTQTKISVIELQLLHEGVKINNRQLWKSEELISSTSQDFNTFT